jgi:8-oxo-dGTP pyrophosphatase MutT (NUDIX family)
MAFAAGMDVFPGGRVDPADGDAALSRHVTRPPDASAVALGELVPAADAVAIHVAAVREAFEEVGFLLADQVDPVDAGAARDRVLAGERLMDAFGGGSIRFATDRLVPIARWTTPRFMPRRFATWFFVADCPPGATFAYEAAEVEVARWLRPIDALDGLASGETAMWIPTVSVLQRLVEIDPSSAADVAARIPFGRPDPPDVVEERADLIRVRSWEGGGLPGRAAEATLHGRRDLVLVDPGDPSEAALAAIDDAVAARGARIAAIVLTSASPDRAAGAEAIAIERGVPVFVAPGAGRHLPADTTDAADGDRLPADVDVRVRLGPPGSGQLAVERR